MSDERRGPEGGSPHETHVAVAAWRALDPHAKAPSAVETIKGGNGRGRCVYRLLHAGADAEPVIAKRFPFGVPNVERVFYRDVMPLLPVSTPRYYGEITAGDGYVWIFLEDVGTERLSPDDAEHRVLATRWLGEMHVAAAALPLAGRLPDRGPPHYRAHLDTGRRLILENLGNPALNDDDRALLREVVILCDTLERRWGALDELCAAAPVTLVHGDFRPKNVFMVPPGRRGERCLLTIDWETAGWATPAADLAPARRRDGPHVDLEAYCDIVRDRWPGFDISMARRLTWVGLIFRRLAAIEWAAVSLGFPTARMLVHALAQLRVYHLELTRALSAESRGFPRD